jgi:hypothetical protein
VVPEIVAVGSSKVASTPIGFTPPKNAFRANNPEWILKKTKTRPILITIFIYQYILRAIHGLLLVLTILFVIQQQTNTDIK